MREHIKLLVADDDDANRRALRETLRQRHQGANVKEVDSCVEATEAMLSGGFDCVILADSLRDGDGIDCLLAARQAGIATPVILLTENDEDIAALQSNDTGATITLPKRDVAIRLLDSCLGSVLRMYRSEQQIKQVQDELRLRDRAIAAASNGIVICDPNQPDCPIVYCNAAFLAITGYSSEEVIGKNCRFLQGTDTNDNDVQQIRDAVREQRECQIVLRNYQKNGTPFWNELTISPVRDTDGNLTHFIGVQTDITQRRDAEDALRQTLLQQQAMMRDVFVNVTEGRLRLCASADDLPPFLTRFSDPIPLAVNNGVRILREQTTQACAVVQIPDERCDGLETAVGEAGMNAIVHSASGTGQVFTGKQDTVQVMIKDDGKGIDVVDLPNATLRRGYSTAGTMGHGFKMMLKMADRVYLLTSGTGTTVVIEQDRVAASPVW